MGTVSNVQGGGKVQGASRKKTLLYRTCLMTEMEIREIESVQCQRVKEILDDETI